MIQRKQSLFLLFSTIVMAVLYFLPIAQFMVDNTNYYFDFLEIATVNDAGKQVIDNVYPITILLSIIVSFSFIAIFLYKNRNFQLRLITINILLKIGYIVLTVFYLYQISNAFESKYYLQISFVYPLIALIFDFMAYKGIQKDMNIIKSYDRIR